MAFRGDSVEDDRKIVMHVAQKWRQFLVDQAVGHVAAIETQRDASRSGRGAPTT